MHHTTIEKRLQSFRSPSEISSSADFLLNHIQLVAFGHEARLAEIEVYLFSPEHPDPFVHRQELQQQLGRWYFHRAGKSFRGGSFKGLDITFGDSGCWGGILIRSLEIGPQKLVCGPSLCVDQILSWSGVPSVAQLHQETNRRVDSDANPLRLQFNSPTTNAAVLSTSRVGLTLANQTVKPKAGAFIARRYRFLREPRLVKKGRVHTILGLHRDGVPFDLIASQTGSPLKSVSSYIETYEQARQGKFDPDSLHESSSHAICVREAVFGE